MNTKAVCALLLLAAAAVSAEEYNCAAEGRVCQNGGVCHEPDWSEINPASGAGNGYKTPYCVCKAPYGGPDCSYTIRECKDSPCQNGGTCRPATCSQTGMNSFDCFTCTCAPGWTGSVPYRTGSANPWGVCDIPQPINDCSVNTCANGGTCSSSRSTDPAGSTFSCTGCSPAGYWVQGTRNNCTMPNGVHCSAVDGNTPCQNGGTCNGGGTSCTCATGFSGSLCQTNFCQNNPCQNGATCNSGNSVTAGSCTCATGFKGTFCQTPTFCLGQATNPCQNSRTCSATTNPASINYDTCDCGEFGGRSCELPRFCDNNPCQNGATCTNTGPGTGMCSNCPQGFAGQFCEKVIQGCGAKYGNINIGCNAAGSSSACACTTQGSCTDLNFNGLCSCSNGWADCRCNTTYVSRCPGNTGALTGRRSNMVCQNGGTCAESAEGTYCSCRPGFWGESCENYDNPCLNAPCQNGGRCGITAETGLRYNARNAAFQGFSFPLDDRYWGYQCTCKWPFYGENCELVAPRSETVCDNNNCQNGGTCGPTGYSAASGNMGQLVGNYGVVGAPYTCFCPSNYTGVYCEQRVTTCASYREMTGTNYCQNGAQCIDGRGNQAGTYPGCMCSCGFAGDRCEIQASNVDATNALTFASTNGGVGYRAEFCSRVSCQNGGTCVHTPNGQDFYCMCKSGYGDRFCGTRVRSSAAGVIPSLAAVAAAVAVAFALKH